MVISQKQLQKFNSVLEEVKTSLESVNKAFAIPADVDLKEAGVSKKLGKSVKFDSLLKKVNGIQSIVESNIE